jgi:acylphosphatase
MSLLAVSIKVEGKVQGVWYRASTKHEADRLGLTGFVKNLPDGAVYIEVCGNPDQIGFFINWCLHGPEHAEVSELKIKKMDFYTGDHFEIIR